MELGRFTHYLKTLYEIQSLYNNEQCEKLVCIKPRVSRLQAEV